MFFKPLTGDGKLGGWVGGVGEGEGAAVLFVTATQDCRHSLLMHAEQLNHTLLICQTYLHINKHDHSYKRQCCWSPFSVVITDE